MSVRIALKLARIENGLTQHQLGLLVGVSQQTIAKWERGTCTPSHFKHLRSLESALGKSPSHLFPDIFRQCAITAESTSQIV